ncbi:MAG: L-serine ammonia-lyase, iron-sulfur-dependent, subunit alpha, partial [Tissierellia bacterium]|nr:L-serine ammonia-lyase, iron-sulfur-dependent, subunit alpha [Tissierellia bacterium]
ELMGGSPEQCFHAAGMALIHIMGLVCDPIAGFVEFPCSLRNASGLVNAFVSADLAMAGIESLVPFDQVVDAMYRVGKMLPEALRETALGGIASSPAAKQLEKKYL